MTDSVHYQVQTQLPFVAHTFLWEAVHQNGSCKHALHQLCGLATSLNNSAYIVRVVTHLDAVTITVVLAFALMVSLTSVLFKECLHTTIQSTILSFPAPSYTPPTCTGIYKGVLLPYLH